MYKNLIYSALVLFSVLITGCGAGDTSDGDESNNLKEEADITGLIYSVSEGKTSFLVVEDIEDSEVEEEEWYGKNAISFSITDETRFADVSGKEMTFEQINKGDKVAVWHTGEVMESYPLQAEAVRIELIE